MRILLTGSQGQVGRCLRDRLPEDWELIAGDSKTLDITDARGVLNMAETFEPDIIVNAAAYTRTDSAENDPDAAFAVNAQGTLNLALTAKKLGARFVHLSTDQVFDGRGHSPIGENEAPNPVNICARSKLAGELLALSTHIDTLVVRSSWVYSEYGRNFVKSVLAAADGNGTFRAVTDCTGCPTYAGDLADVLIRLVRLPHPPRGILHFTGPKQETPEQFARTILRMAAQKNTRYAEVAINSVTRSGYSAVADRPAYTVLDCSAVRSLLPEGLPATPLQETVDKLLALQ